MTANKLMNALKDEALNSRLSVMELLRNTGLSIPTIWRLLTETWKSCYMVDVYIKLADACGCCLALRNAKGTLIAKNENVERIIRKVMNEKMDNASLEKIAERVKVSRYAVYCFKGGKRKMRLDTVCRIAASMGGELRLEKKEEAK